MSTNFIPSDSIPLNALKTFDRDGVHTVYKDGDLLLTDGRNYLCVWSSPIMFERCGANDPTNIITAIEAAFNVCLVSEYEN